jgi:hypothetical protein
MKAAEFIRILFREEVPAFHRLSVRARSPLTPDAQQTSVLYIEVVERINFWTAPPRMQCR